MKDITSKTKISNSKMISIFKGNDCMNYFVDGFSIDTAKEIIEKDFPELQVSIEYNRVIGEYSIFSNLISEEILVINALTDEVVETNPQFVHVVQSYSL